MGEDLKYIIVKQDGHELPITFPALKSHVQHPYGLWYYP